MDNNPYKEISSKSKEQESQGLNKTKAYKEDDHHHELDDTIRESKISKSNKNLENLDDHQVPLLTNNQHNVDNFVKNDETANGDHLDQDISEGKHTTRPRTNTYDNTKLPINQMRKHLNNVLHPRKNKKNKKKMHSHIEAERGCEHGHSHHNDNDSDIEEATMKNVISSKGKFLSLLQARNLCN